jgi:hypothetical protein
MKNGAENNTDGAGICWVDKFGTKEAQVAWQKGFKSDAEEVLEYIKQNDIKYPFAIHFRTASIGGKCEELTHPFPITAKLEDFTSGYTRRVLMHNGHISSWKEWFTKIMFAAPNLEIPIGPWSDSRALAAAVFVKGEGILDFVMESSRVLVLDSLPSVGCKKSDPASYSRQYGRWIEKEGYSQSTETYSRAVICHRGSPVNHCRVVSPTVVTKAPDENCWTVEELDELVTIIRKEQDEARILLGV